MEHLTQHIESLIFTTEHPISTEEILSVLEETFETVFEVDTLEKALTDLKDRYKEENFSFELVEIANGFQFLTKGAYHQTVGTYLKQTTKKRLSRAAIETLSMVAYKQPVSKSELEKIRGVSCDYSIQKLLEKELVTILGRADTPGRPLLYGTTEKFMDYFGIKSLKDLPKPKDFKTPDSEIGEAAPIEEDVPESNEEPNMANEILPIDDEGTLDTAEEGAPDTTEEETTDTDDSSLNPETEEDIADIEQEDTQEEDAQNEAEFVNEESIEQEATEVNDSDTIDDDSSNDANESELKDELENTEEDSIEDKTDGISNADVSIETLDGAFDQEE